jgi:hypothetical protein
VLREERVFCVSRYLEYAYKSMKRILRWISWEWMKINAVEHRLSGRLTAVRNLVKRETEKMTCLHGVFVRHFQ